MNNSWITASRISIFPNLPLTPINRVSVQQPLEAIGSWESTVHGDARRI